MSENEVKREKKWKPLESNPEVMNKYLERLGVRTENCPLEFCDVYGLDNELLSMVPQPVAAVLLVYPINEAAEEYNAEVMEATLKLGKKDEETGEVTATPGSAAFFTAQTISNACGTIAILHAIGNNKNFFYPPQSSDAEADDKEILVPDGFAAKFFEATKNMTPDQRAKYLEGDDDLEEAQAASASEGQTSSPSADDDVHLHFVCFTRSPDGFLVELDGRKKFPIPHGRCEKPEDILEAAATAIKKFIELAGDSALSSLAITALAGKQ